MENLERILEAHPFLNGMSKEHIRLLVGCAKNALFKKGEFLFREGEPANVFYFIREGKVQVETHVPHRGTIAIRTRAADDVFGWSWLVPPYRWHFDGRAVETTRALALDGECLRQKCEQDHDLGYELMKRFAFVIAERLEATRLQLMDVYGDVAGR